MTSPDTRARLRHLAVLYLNLAHRTDDFLSPAEIASITEKLQARFPATGWASVQDVVMEALDAYAGADDGEALVMQTARALNDTLSPRQKREVLQDLHAVAGADGVVLDGERGILTGLARQWGVDLEYAAPEAAGAPPQGPGWGVLHDLAYLYLHLAHATDYELSPQEMQVMLNKLHEWHPQFEPGQIQQVLQEAMASYARGADEALMARAIASVRDNLPQAQRMAALNDLIKIANADGVFLDIEEDMINHLLAAWGVDPSANYESRGSKG